MRRTRAVRAEVARGADQSFAEMILPESIHHHASGERVVGVAARMDLEGLTSSLMQPGNHDQFITDGHTQQATATLIRALGADTPICSLPRQAIGRT